MQPHWTLNLSNGLRVNVPADLDNPVALTLLEVKAQLADLAGQGVTFVTAVPSLTIC